MSKAELYIGLMSGTSLDAMDAVLVEFTTDCGDHKILSTTSIPYELSLKSRLHKFNSTELRTLSEVALLDCEVALLASRAVKDVLKKVGKQASDIKAVAFAGQTIGHSPSKGSGNGWTAQCGDPNILAEETGIQVVADFRRRDVAAGGQGAPLASAFHQAFFTSDAEDRCIINLGGISNITILRQGKEPSGFDMGPANCLLDEWAEAHGQGVYDDKGQWAASGRVINDLLVTFLGDAYFSKTPPKTTGRDYFNLQWVQSHLQSLESGYKNEDVQATLVDLTALSISLAVHSCFNSTDIDHKLSVYVAGGGALNDHLMDRMNKLIKFPVKKIEELGVASKQLEALAFAWLARLRLHNQVSNIPRITGAKGQRFLGGVYA